MGGLGAFESFPATHGRGHRTSSSRSFVAETVGLGKTVAGRYLIPLLHSMRHALRRSFLRLKARAPVEHQGLFGGDSGFTGASGGGPGGLLGGGPGGDSKRCPSRRRAISALAVFW